MQLSEGMKTQAENVVLLIDHIYKREPANDRLKVAYAMISEIDEPTKTFITTVMNELSRRNDIFKGCICHRDYIEKGGIRVLFDELKAVCAKSDFEFNWATEFIHKHARPNKNGKTWVFESGEYIKNPIAVFTNWCKKYKKNESAYYAP